MSRPLAVEFAPSETRNLFVRIASLPVDGNSLWLAALDSFASSGAQIRISVLPKAAAILASLPEHLRSLAVVEKDATVCPSSADFALGVCGSSVPQKLARFVATCREARIPVFVPGYPLLSDFSVARHSAESASESGDSAGDVSDTDSNSLTALNSSPATSPTLSPLDFSPLPDSAPVDLKSMFVVPPKNAGFSVTSFIPAPAFPTSTPSTLTIVGAGPGTPSLLTVAAITAIQACTLLIVDRLVPTDLLHYALTTQIVPHQATTSSPKDCEPRRIPYILHTRKVLGNAPLAQQEIEDWTAAAVRLGHAVVRLKGGDPFVYGRGGEELLSAQKVEVPVPGGLRGETKPCVVNVVPGLSSSLVAPLMAGIPATHRGVADQVLIATGRLEEEEKEVEWPLYAPNRTTVVLMAMGRIRRVVKGMTQDAGYPLETPVALVEKAGWGKENGERVWKGDLSQVVEAVQTLGMKAHATLIVGRVVHALG
ncbi:uroporphyrin-III C-methyltransferase [Podochytrium sp. JEL0797]|nr:uroporphyrin-III C-methyltransferase [Podochytrium sp. JEL0797]